MNHTAINSRFIEASARILKDMQGRMYLPPTSYISRKGKIARDKRTDSGTSSLAILCRKDCRNRDPWFRAFRNEPYPWSLGSNPIVNP